VREELQERQALVREELNQEILKMAMEKEREVLMANHHNEIINTPSIANDTNGKKKQPNDYEVILPRRINRHIIQQKNHATKEE